MGPRDATLTHVDSSRSHGQARCVCSCQQDALCSMCLESRYMQLKGVAQSRAHRWVQDLARRVPASHQWPHDSERMLRLARYEVSDLAKDERLLEMLAKECVEAAEREWASASSLDVRMVGATSSQR